MTADEMANDELREVRIAVTQEAIWEHQWPREVAPTLTITSSAANAGTVPTTRCR